MRRGVLVAVPVSLVVLAGSAGLGYREWRDLWSPSFSDSGLVTNERAFEDPDEPNVKQSDEWIVTSGSLFADDGDGFTGQVDATSPNATSSNGTNSAVFRAVSRPRDFDDVRIDLSLDPLEMVSTQRTGRNDFDGIHVFARYTSDNSLYAITLCRRDGQVVVKKKTPHPDSADGGDYVTLAEEPQPCLTDWTKYSVTTVNESGGVRITVWVDGDQALSVLDNGAQGGAALTSPGRVGVRGDNTEFRFRDFEVTRA